MDLATIENQIQEYLDKLNQKTLRKIKKTNRKLKLESLFIFENFMKKKS